MRPRGGAPPAPSSRGSVWRRASHGVTGGRRSRYPPVSKRTFACDGGDCSTTCVPDAVTIRVTGYSYRTFMNYLGLPAVQMPNFMTSMAIESAGCDPEQGTCLP